MIYHIEKATFHNTSILFFKQYCYITRMTEYEQLVITSRKRSD